MVPASRGVGGRQKSIWVHTTATTTGWGWEFGRSKEVQSDEAIVLLGIFMEHVPHNLPSDNNRLQLIHQG